MQVDTNKKHYPAGKPAKNLRRKLVQMEYFLSFLMLKIWTGRGGKLLAHSQVESGM